MSFILYAHLVDGVSRKGQTPILALQTLHGTYRQRPPSLGGCSLDKISACYVRFQENRGEKASDNKGIQSERTALRVGWSGKAFLMSAFMDHDLVHVLWDGKL